MTDNHVVLITGGNTGIGYETVKALYESGIPYVILMGSRSLDKAKDAISKLQSEVSTSKSEVVPVQIDIESDDSIANAVKEVESKYGRLDTLINNAGMVLSIHILCQHRNRHQMILTLCRGFIRQPRSGNARTERAPRSLGPRVPCECLLYSSKYLRFHATTPEIDIYTPSRLYYFRSLIFDNLFCWPNVCSRLTIPSCWLA